MIMSSNYYLTYGYLCLPQILYIFILYCIIHCIILYNFLRVVLFCIKKGFHTSMKALILVRWRGFKPSTNWNAIDKFLSFHQQPKPFISNGFIVIIILQILVLFIKYSGNLYFIYLITIQDPTYYIYKYIGVYFKIGTFNLFPQPIIMDNWKFIFKYSYH